MKNYLTSIKEEITFKNNVVIVFPIETSGGVINSIGFDTKTKELPSFIINEKTESLVDFVLEEFYGTYSYKVEEDDLKYLCELKVPGFGDIDVFMVDEIHRIKKGRSSNSEKSSLIFTSVENKKFDFITEAILYNYLKNIYE